MTTKPPKPVKYLSNKELLAEIHRCKTTYCEFLSPEYKDYDLIVNDLDLVTPKMVEDYLTKANSKLPEGEAPKTIDAIVVRLMTYEHIPLDPDRKRKSKEANQFHAKTNFPPFKHFLLVIEDDVYTYREVGRSHWEGGFENGWFNPDRGRMSERLGKMFMMLVDKYARRGNWRGYCVSEDSEALTQRGWLTHDEITTDDTILSYDNGQLKWSAIKSIFRDKYKGKMFHLTAVGLDALVTPHHKFVTDSGLKEVDHLLEKDRLILMGDAVDAPLEKTHSDDLVEIVGWVITEGNFHNDKARNYTRVSIYQNEGEYAERIRGCLSRLGARFSEDKKPGKNNIRFCLTKSLCLQLSSLMEDKVPSMEFMLSLTQEQRMMLINTMIDGDGWRTGASRISYTQKCKKHIDFFTSLCALAGIRTAIKLRKMTSFGKPTEVYVVNLFTTRRNVSQVENIDFHGGKSNGTTKGVGKFYHPNQPTVDYDGLVWCPETEFGSFITRRNGLVHLTGNTYRDEMMGMALTQLARVGLQFDESKSQNPFAFFTTTVNHCFTRTLNLEKRSQNIRDDLLIHYGMAPSYTRQIENELIQNGTIEPKPIPAKRGRKSAAQKAAEKEAEKPIQE